MSTNTTTHTPGPELLNERSLGGIAVHLLALPTGAVGAGLVYLVSSHEYTRANARNALNWHLSVLAVTVLAFATFFLGADEVTIDGEVVEFSLVPAPLDAVFSLVGAALLVGTMLVWTATLLFALIATGKAIFGTAWQYPGAYEFVDAGRARALAGDDAGPRAGTTRWRVLATYVVLVPVVASYGAWSIQSASDVSVFPLVLGVLTLFVLAILTFFALFRDARARRGTESAWEPTWWLYVGVPLVAGGLVYLVSSATGSMNPAGDAAYGVMIALWATAVHYLVQHHRYADRS